MIQVSVEELESYKHHSKTYSFKLKSSRKISIKTEIYELKPGHNDLKVSLSSKDVLNVY